MSTKTVDSSSETAVWGRIQLEGDLPPTAARALLTLHFAQQDHDRMHTLLEKARAGTLTGAEQAEADNYERLGCLLDILHSKARLALKKHKPAS
jgi:hypothetical protein